MKYLLNIVEKNHYCKIFVIGCFIYLQIKMLKTKKKSLQNLFDRSCVVIKVHCKYTNKINCVSLFQNFTWNNICMCRNTVQKNFVIHDVANWRIINAFISFLHHIFVQIFHGAIIVAISHFYCNAHVKKNVETTYIVDMTFNVKSQNYWIIQVYFHLYPSSSLYHWF